MGNDEGNLKQSELMENVFQLFKDFMARLAKLEELGTAGSKSLTDYQRGIEFLRRPPLDRTSELIENIVKANDTKRMKMYFEAGCMNVHDRVQNMTKLGTSLLGLHDHLSKARSILEELECLVEDVSNVIQTATECLSPFWDKDLSKCMDLLAINAEEVTKSGDRQEPDMTEIAALMGIIYSMVKQDYTMQERIVTSLNLTSSSGELDSYCLMWSLRPFISDEIMRQAWRLIP